MGRTAMAGKRSYNVARDRICRPADVCALAWGADSLCADHGLHFRSLAAEKAKDIFVDLLILAVAVFLVYQGMVVIDIVGNQTMTGLGISVIWMYAALPVFGVAVAALQIAEIVDPGRPAAHGHGGETII